MSLANRITSLLTSLTPRQISALAPVDRQLLANECARILRLAQVERIGARDAAAPQGGVIDRLNQGERSL